MYQKTVLPNGVRIVSEQIPYVRSAALGIWVLNGSRHEPKELSGISHFIEHMMFKGTERRSAEHIAIAMDALGGQFNAFTTKECTCYYLKTLDSHLQTGAEILADMFLHSKFAKEDLELERGVVLEEIDMYEDSPEDVATEKIFEASFSGDPLGRPILGSRETLLGITGEDLHSYIAEYYRPEDTVVALSGSFTPDDLDYICKLFSEMTGSGRNQFTPATYHISTVTRSKDIEQMHLCLGFEGISMDAEERYTNALLSSILGGGMSSRLFQTVRERNGLCYSVYSYSISHQDTGMFGIYTALNKETEERALRLIREECIRLTQDGPDRAELNRCREQVKSNLLMGLESTTARMNQLGRSELFYDHTADLDEIIEHYDAVTIDDITDLARRILNFDRASICAVGKTSEPDYYRSILQD
ncbi:MAG: M16 family metallopeptidase [Butyricicoccaceae bacterium]